MSETETVDAPLIHKEIERAMIVVQSFLESFGYADMKGTLDLKMETFYIHVGFPAPPVIAAALPRPTDTTKEAKP